MPQNPLPACKIRQLLRLCLANNFNRSQAAKRLRIARNTAKKYINAFSGSALTLSEIDHVGGAELGNLLFPTRKRCGFR
jgi:hypothetical protein